MVLRVQMKKQILSTSSVIVLKQSIHDPACARGGDTRTGTGRTAVQLIDNGLDQGLLDMDRILDLE